MRSTGKVRAAFACALALAALFAPRAAAGPVAAIHYVITLERDAGGVRALDIAVAVPLDATGTAHLVLPSRWAAASNLWDNIDAVSVSPASASFKRTSDAFGQISGAPLTTAVLRYRVSQRWSGGIVRSSYFKPMFTGDNFVVTAASGLIYPSFMGSRMSVSFEWHVPAGEFAADCLTESGSEAAELDEGQLQNCLLFGGPFARDDLALRDGPVHVFQRGDWPFSLSAFSQRLGDIVEYERRFWRVRAMAPYSVILVPTDEPSGNYGGTAYTDIFVLYVPRGAQLNDAINHLFAHEYFHNWNPGRLFSLAPPEAQEYWFSEGFTEYYAYRFLLRLRLTSPYDYVSALNARLRSYYVAPESTLPNATVAEHYFEPAMTPVDYVRGELLALNWNERIRARSNGRLSLDDAFRALEAGRNGRVATDTPGIAAAFAPYAGASAVQDVAAYVERGMRQLPPARIFEPCATLKMETVYGFDAGFDLRASGLSGTLKGVEPNGPAYRAGLRDGQQFSRHLITRNAALPVHIVLQTPAGSRAVTYLPQGAAHIAPQYVPVMPASRFNSCFANAKRSA